MMAALRSAMTLAVRMLLQHCTDRRRQSVARDYTLGLFVSNVQAATNATLAVDEFAAVLGGHACAEPDGAFALDAADAVWIVHRKPLPIVTKTPRRGLPYEIRTKSFGFGLR